MRYSLFLILVSCASTSDPMAVRFSNAPPVTVVDDRRPVPSAPSKNYTLNDYDFLVRSFTDPVTRSLELPEATRARGVNSLDEVPDSTWFTNRIGVRDLTPAEIAKGSVDDDGPEAHKPWTVHGTKPGGTELGFSITDSRGVKYLISFDEVTRPEMETASAIVVNRLLWAAGYNVPQDQVAYVRPEELVLAPDAVIKDRLGVERRHLDDWTFHDKLSKAWRTPDGRIRVMASKILPGDWLGGPPMHGVRDDDPNDKIPHQDRRDQRGLYPLTSWLGHVDLVRSNWLDMLVADQANPSVRYVVHFLVDFGKSLGTMGVTDSYIREGYNYSFDWRAHISEIFTLGLLPRPWNCRLNPGPPLGVSPTFTPEYFTPNEWKPDIPVPAFDNADRYDMFWGAKILARYTPEQIRAAVEAARYTDPAATNYVVQTLLSRQAAIVKFWFSKVNPLDRFAVQGNALCFSDLAIDHQLASAANTHYELMSYDGRGRGMGAVTVPAAATGATCTHAVIVSSGADSYTIVKITTQRAEYAGSTLVHLAKAPTGEWRVIGVWRI